MKELKRDLQSVVKSLKSLTQKTEKIAKKLAKLEKTQAAEKSKAKVTAKAAKKTVAKKAAKVTANDTVFEIIKRSRRDVGTAVLKKKTGFEGRKIRDIIYRLKKQGKIKSERKGFYAKA